MLRESSAHLEAVQREAASHLPLSAPPLLLLLLLVLVREDSVIETAVAASRRLAIKSLRNSRALVRR